MADQLISKVKLGGTIYHLKDEEARRAVEAIQTAISSSLVFKGVVSSATEITSLTNYKTGQTYRANASFEITSLGKLEAGDLIICISDYSSSYKASDWTVAQNNVDTMTGATSTAAGTRGLVPAPQAGDQNKLLKANGSWSKMAEDSSGNVTFSGNLSARYVTGTRLQGTSTGRLTKTPSKFAVLDDSGWVYYRTKADLQSDLGIEGPSWGSFSDLIG